MVNYTIKERVNPQTLLAPRKYYAFAQNQGMINMRQLANLISRESTLSMMDILAVLEGLIQIIPDNLLDGKMISLGALGSFRVTISSKGADTKDDFTENHIIGLNLKFRPGIEFRNTLKSAKFKKVSTPQKKITK